jgi:hypothetical protein
LLIKGVKSLRQNKFFTDFVLHLFTLVKHFLPPLPEVCCSSFLDFLNPWGKVMERRALRLKNFCV